MILPLQNPVSRKRWTYKLADLGLDPLKFNDDEGRDYDKESGKVGNLVAPNIIVSAETEGMSARKYALFDSYVQVYNYCMWLRTNNQIPHLYEVCPYFSKIHFDLDITGNDATDFDFEELELKNNRYYVILRPYLQSIERVFAKLFPLNYDPVSFFTNLLVFEAHRPGEKISFHIVVDGFYLPCHESWLFYKEVVDDLVHEGMVLQSGFADFSVYKKNQSFRMFGSNKGTMRTATAGIKQIYNGPDLELSPGKVFSRKGMVDSCFKNESIQDPKLVNLRVLERSLISNTIGNIRLTLNSSKASNSNRKIAMERVGQRALSEVTISDEGLKTVLEIFFRSSLSNTKTGERAFGFEKVIPGDIICLKRLRGSYCSICERTHDSENSWLTLSPTGDIYFVCRRAHEKRDGGGHRMYVGNVNH